MKVRVHAYPFHQLINCGPKPRKSSFRGATCCKVQQMENSENHSSKCLNEIPAKNGKRRAPVGFFWKVWAIALAIAAAVLSIALIVVLATLSHTDQAVKPSSCLADSCELREQRCNENLAAGTIFAGIAASEYDTIRDFLFSQKKLGLVSVRDATLDKNYIYLIEDYLPSKSEVLLYQRSQSSKPLRRAKVVLFMGGENPKTVKEYIVYPVSNPTTIELYNNSAERGISWSSRPLCLNVEVKQLDTYLKKELAKVTMVLNESFGQWYDDSCGEKCIFYNLAPRTAGENRERHIYAWFYLNFRELRGYYLHPVSFYVIIHMPGNGSNFFVKNVYYNDKRFVSLEELLLAYMRGSVEKIVDTSSEQYVNSFGSPARRGEDANPANRRPPEQFYPDGSRFSVNGQHIQYMGWSFDVYFRSVSGLQLFNVQHKGEEVAYEVSMQDIVAAYSGAEPENYFKAYFDNGWSVGTRSHPLLRGVDCPSGAVYFDAFLYAVGSDRSTRMKDTACVFEHRNSVPLRRHISEDFYDGGFNFVFSMPDSVLIVRQIITLWNYDYIFDYEFHQNGVVEAKVSSTGYVAATVNRYPQYGTTLDSRTHTGANIHSHLFNFKFDVDVAESSNRFMTVDLVRDNSTTNPLFPGQWHQTKITENLKSFESDAVIHYNFDTPKYLVIFNQNRNNSRGYHRGYRIQSSNFVKVLAPEESPLMKGASWAKSQMCVTRHKDTERGTASIYTQGDPERPVVDFEKFYADNENIVDKDLVAWVTVGMLHIPTAEDIPVTSTPGKTLSVILAPFSFFDEDPSITSKDAVLIEKKEMLTKTVNAAPCLP